MRLSNGLSDSTREHQRLAVVALIAHTPHMPFRFTLNWPELLKTK